MRELYERLKEENEQLLRQLEATCNATWGSGEHLILHVVLSIGGTGSGRALEAEVSGAPEQACRGSGGPSGTTVPSAMANAMPEEEKVVVSRPASVKTLRAHRCLL